MPRVRQRRVVAVLGALEALPGRLKREALRQGISHAPQVVWLREGARGWWRLCAAGLADEAPGIGDFDHAVQQRWQAAAAWLDGRTSQARRGCLWARHRLRHGHPDGVRADLADALAWEG